MNKASHYIRVPKRILSWGERMNSARLSKASRIKDERIRKANARRLKKQALSQPDNL